MITGAAARVVASRAPGASTASGLEPTRWAGAPARLARMDRLCALALTACDACLLDGALAPGGAAWDPERTAIVLGSAFGCHATNEEFYRGQLAGAPSPRLFAYTLPSSPVGEIAIHYQARGVCLTIASGLAAGVEALAWGLRLVRSGRADRVLVVAADAATPLLAELNGLTNSPTGDESAAWLLERADHARTRGATARVRLLRSASHFVASDRAAAREAATRELVDNGAPAKIFANDAAATTRASELVATMAPAPLIAATAWLAAPTGRAVVAAGDPAGGGAAVLLAAVED